MMKTYNELAQSVKLKIKGAKVVVEDKDQTLDFIGEGRSAIAFKIQGTNKVLKVFFPSSIHLAKKEAEIYKQLHGNPFYSDLHDFGSNYLVIDYIEGDTLFNCLSKGIAITADHIKEIDYAIKLARENGLNPSDIHLRNIIITPQGKVKIIDVARYRQTKACSQWQDLKTAFYKYYKPHTLPKKIPATLLNLVAYLYKRNLLGRFLINI